ncbi:hypothetical protein BC751_0248 [Cecembia calidifontis]|uniref:Uncharacterized protein n=1 Tax=Cecembia calidifontis TaxID=1187080 RepID=A0A4Q7P5K4_9BACT|nr:hypothetical protein BC751_0248 [Cecembia calidifontis]
MVSAHLAQKFFSTNFTDYTNRLGVVLISTVGLVRILMALNWSE